MKRNHSLADQVSGFFRPLLGDPGAAALACIMPLLEVGLTEISRHVIGCRFTQEKRVRDEAGVDDVAENAATS
jgi:hypothetical protein